MMRAHGRTWSLLSCLLEAQKLMVISIKRSRMTFPSLSVTIVALPRYPLGFLLVSYWRGSAVRDFTACSTTYGFAAFRMISVTNGLVALVPRLEAEHWVASWCRSHIPFRLLEDQLTRRSMIYMYACGFGGVDVQTRTWRHSMAK